MLRRRNGKTHGPYASLAAAQTAGAVSINYGFFVNTIISFVIIAAVVFFFVVRPIAQTNARQAARVAPAPAAAPSTKDCPNCTSQLQAS